MSIVLYGFWRSTAAMRVRIALRLKGLAHQTIPINLRTGEQLTEDYADVNPQGFVPFLIDGDTAIGQSLAIIEYLDEMYPDPPLVPGNAAERARIRGLAQVVACDIHPINNLRILKHLSGELGLEQAEVDAWARRWIERGFATLEVTAAKAQRYLAGDVVTLADICLVPQLYNARRVSTDLSGYPGLLAVEARLMELPAFADARPEVQPDAVPV